MRPHITFAVIAGSLLASGCETTLPPPMTASQSAVLPSRIPADQFVGDWGLASYHQESARARTEAAARGQCRNPYRIAKGPTGGVMMHLADGKQLTELRLKGSPEGKNYLGPEGPVGEADREIMSFDGNVIVMRWLDADASKRFGTMIYSRCGRRA